MNIPEDIATLQRLRSDYEELGKRLSKAKQVGASFYCQRAANRCDDAVALLATLNNFPAVKFELNPEPLKTP